MTKISTSRRKTAGNRIVVSAKIASRANNYTDGNGLIDGQCLCFKYVSPIRTRDRETWGD